MCRNPNECCCPAVHSVTEWRVVLVLLSTDYSPFSREELRREVCGPDADRLGVESAIENLYVAGLVNVSGELVSASRATRHFDGLLGGTI